MSDIPNWVVWVVAVVCIVIALRFVMWVIEGEDAFDDELTKLDKRMRGEDEK